MPRPLRPNAPDGLYHVIARGVRRLPIVHDNRDRRRYLAHLGVAVDRHEWICHEFCLMTNHAHLLIQTPEANLSEGMQWLSGTYAQWFNWRHDFTGHLFERRFESVVVHSQLHLLELSRYIVLNPIRAGICALPEQYVWSSFRATAGLTPAPELLTSTFILEQFAPEPTRAQQRYRDFVRDGIAEALARAA